MGGAASLISSGGGGRGDRGYECPPLVPTAPLVTPPHQPMVRYDKCTRTAYLDEKVMATRQATDQELTMMQYWSQQGLEDLPSPSLPFCGWPYCRRLIWGCCLSDADVLQRIAQPQLVANYDLAGYAPPPTQTYVWVNYPNFGMARVVGFTSLHAATQMMLYFVVQKLQPFGTFQGDPFGAYYFYRVPAMWCQRMPAAVTLVRPDFGDVLVWEITDTTSTSQVITVNMDAFRDPRGRADENELNVARAFLQRDWPQQALSMFPRTAVTDRYMPTDRDLRRWYGYEPRPTRGHDHTHNGGGGDSNTSQQQQQQNQQQTVNVIRVKAALNMNDNVPQCAFHTSSTPQRPLLTDE